MNLNEPIQCEFSKQTSKSKKPTSLRGDCFEAKGRKKTDKQQEKESDTYVPGGF